MEKPPNPTEQAETIAAPASEPSDAAPIPPELRDHPKYRVIGLIGQGGMGAVYKAEHRLMERTVALKVVNPAFIDNAAAVRRFQQEVKAAARLQHPNIVTSHDADQAGMLHFLVMEYVDGRSLADYAREKGPLPVHEACEYARQAALGLQYAHEHGLVHRDVKPHNLMRTPDGQIKILDFGLARLRQTAPDEPGPTATDAEPAAASLTAVGAVMGTADYIAPEQAIDSHQADARSDIYSLGCTLFHLLTGSVPFPGGTPMDKVGRHAAEPVPDPSRLRRGLPGGLAAVVRKMTVRSPADRYQTPGEAAHALAPFAAPPRKRQPRRFVAVGLLLLGLLAAGVAALLIRQAWAVSCPEPAASGFRTSGRPSRRAVPRRPTH